MLKTSGQIFKVNKFLSGGGEMGQLTRSYNWSKTLLGAPENWPQSLLTTVSIVLESRFPMFLWWGPQFIQFYNDAYRPSLGATGKHPIALGQKGEDCWSEIWPVIKPLIDKVMSGEGSTWSEDQLIPIYRNDRLEDVYWTFSYSSVRDDNGEIAGVLVTCMENTEKIQALKHLELNQENFQNMVRQAPVGMCIVKGDPLFVKEVNDLFLEIIGKRREQFFDMPYWEVNAEAAAYYSPITEEVMNTGKTYHANEHEIMLIRHGKEEIVFVDFVYEPIKNIEGLVDAIMIVAIEITDQVRARKELESAYEQARLSKKAAELGTFDMDLIKGTMEWDERCRTLFGISHSGEVSYEKDFVPGLHPDDRDRVQEIIKNVFVKAVSNGDYDVEYRTIGVEDKKLRWVRAKGKTYFNSRDEPVRFIGSVLDITELKQDELRKNDFIGMVSHELKTPLTSLTAIIQVLNTKLKNSEDKFVAGAAEKANVQVKKMVNMINGFLNISRLEAGKINIDKQTFVLYDLIKEVVEEISITASSHTIIFLPFESILINADRDKIGSVISNLLTNAIKYSPKGKLIEVKCEVNGDNVQVSIKDEGMGVKPQELEKLFERFYRVETQRTSHIAGFGIGLYLSAEIIERHHGKIWVESGSGVGSTFHFSLPLARVELK